MVRRGGSRGVSSVPIGCEAAAVPHADKESWQTLGRTSCVVLYTTQRGSQAHALRGKGYSGRAAKGIWRSKASLLPSRAKDRGSWAGGGGETRWQHALVGEIMCSLEIR